MFPALFLMALCQSPALPAALSPDECSTVCRCANRPRDPAPDVVQSTPAAVRYVERDGIAYKMTRDSATSTWGPRMQVTSGKFVVNTGAHTGHIHQAGALGIVCTLAGAASAGVVQTAPVPVPATPAAQAPQTYAAPYAPYAAPYAPYAAPYAPYAAPYAPYGAMPYGGSSCYGSSYYGAAQQSAPVYLVEQAALAYFGGGYAGFSDGDDYSPMSYASAQGVYGVPDGGGLFGRRQRSMRGTWSNSLIARGPLGGYISAQSFHGMARGACPGGYCVLP
jgi:hypothetical protein